MSSIIPYIQTTTRTITSFNVIVNSITLFSSANLLVSNYDESGQFVNAVNLIMDGNDYAQWGGDDSYVVNWVAIQLGYTLENTGSGSVSYNK
jgi:hypothetical protein